MINNSWTRKNPFPNNRDSFVYGVDQVFFHGAPAHVHAARTERGETRINGPFRDYAKTKKSTHANSGNYGLDCEIC